jgi:hypothetical protein
MKVYRPIMLVCAFLAANIAPASHEPIHKASILPEVQKHLDDARECSANGTPDVAAAHASLVLVDDEVTYSIQFTGVGNGQRSRCLKAMEGAFDAWAKSLDDTISFREVATKEKADVIFHFKPTVMMGKEPVAGFANWKRTLMADGPRVKVVEFRSDLQIRTSDLNGDSMPLTCVRHEIAHELGHVLGLEDSDTTGDLMGPLDMDHPVGGPQTYESDAVRKIRDEAHRLRTDAQARAQKL